jgi:hypothetical protein
MYREDRIIGNQQGQPPNRYQPNQGWGSPQQPPQQPYQPPPQYYQHPPTAATSLASQHTLSTPSAELVDWKACDWHNPLYRISLCWSLLLYLWLCSHSSLVSSSCSVYLMCCWNRNALLKGLVFKQAGTSILVAR